MLDERKCYVLFLPKLERSVCRGSVVEYAFVVEMKSLWSFRLNGVLSANDDIINRLDSLASTGCQRHSLEFLSSRSLCSRFVSNRYYKLLHRIDPDPPNVYERIPAELGDPQCVYYFRDEHWKNETAASEPITLDRPFPEQFPMMDQQRKCVPTPYPDGTPHFYEVLWQEATGDPHLTWCAGFDPFSWQRRGVSMHKCRPFTSSRAQKDALAASMRSLERGEGEGFGVSTEGMRSLELDRGEGSDRTLFLFTNYATDFSMKFEKCPKWPAVLSAIVSVVATILGTATVLASVSIARVCRSVIHTKHFDRARIRHASVVLPSAVSNYQENQRLQRRVAQLEAEIEALNPQRLPPNSAEDAEDGGTYGSMGRAPYESAAPHDSVAESAPPPVVETPLRRRRASTDYNVANESET